MAAALNVAIVAAVAHSIYDRINAISLADMFVTHFPLVSEISFSLRFLPLCAFRHTLMPTGSVAHPKSVALPSRCARECSQKRPDQV